MSLRMNDLEARTEYSKSKLRVQEPLSHARTDLPTQALYVFLINHYICESPNLQNIGKPLCFVQIDIKIRQLRENKSLRASFLNVHHQWRVIGFACHYKNTA